MFSPRRILAAVDFSDCSRVALNLAARLAAQCAAELTVLHAQDPLLDRAAETAGIDLRHETEDELTRFVRTATAGRTDRLVITGRAAEVICQIAQREQADLIVIGAHGMSGMAHALFGSTTERVIRRTPLSVLVVPASWKGASPSATRLDGIGPVVAGVDATAGAAAAAVAAADLAALLRTPLDLIRVVTPILTPARWTAHAKQAMADATQRAGEELALLVRGLRRDVHVRTRVEAGDVATVLAQAARPSGANRAILVLGRSPLGSNGAEPGAIAYRVLMEAEAPVLVYLPPD